MTDLTKGNISRTWGSGSHRSTMVVHIRKHIYEKMGWNIGDSIFVEPDTNGDRICIKRIDLSKINID